MRHNPSELHIILPNNVLQSLREVLAKLHTTKKQGQPKHRNLKSKIKAKNRHSQLKAKQ